MEYPGHLLTCTCCKKSYKTSKSFEKHLEGNKHKANAEKDDDFNEDTYWMRRDYEMSQELAKSDGSMETFASLCKKYNKI